MRQTALRTISLGIVVLVLFAAPGASPQSGPPVHAITAQPVSGVSIGPGKKLWVLVFPARGKGKPGTTCTSDGEQTEPVPSLGSLLPGAVSFNINDASIPIDKDAADTAIRASFAAWEQAVGLALFNVSSNGGASVPDADGNNTVGWVKIVPKNVLAATWIWTETGADGKDYVTDVDIFYNLFHQWGVFSECTSTESRFEVQNIGTHEAGHVLGLDHLSDTERMATMYPSAPKGEVKKQSLTFGDEFGANAVTEHLKP